MTLLEFGAARVRPQRRQLRRRHRSASPASSPADKDGGFELARYQIACCAADAIPVVVHVVGTAGAVPGRDGWVAVTGKFRKGGHGEIPDLVATSVVALPAPEDPYE